MLSCTFERQKVDEEQNKDELCQLYEAWIDLNRKVRVQAGREAIPNKQRLP